MKIDSFVLPHGLAINKSVRVRACVLQQIIENKRSQYAPTHTHTHVAPLPMVYFHMVLLGRYFGGNICVYATNAQQQQYSAHIPNKIMTSSFHSLIYTGCVSKLKSETQPNGMHEVNTN